MVALVSSGIELGFPGLGASCRPAHWVLLCKEEPLSLLRGGLSGLVEGCRSHRALDSNLGLSGKVGPPPRAPTLNSQLLDLIITSWGVFWCCWLWRDRATCPPPAQAARCPQPSVDTPPPLDWDPTPLSPSLRCTPAPLPGSRGRPDEDGIPAAQLLGRHPAGGCGGVGGPLRVRTPTCAPELLPPRSCPHLSPGPPVHIHRAHTTGTHHTHVTPHTSPVCTHHTHHTGM